ncbi:hypothetical protein COV82_04340 [Candidatus Peregrinibacteria bacterium CG11_big_fil_rev_8_21_14_0_20_46_8]|nr:MAG: hypothetical protein COV82_04340 [Candidatus Peregrinibacteria bacterium CG11_big_fil_rev_8_21_14_0_20_46_8]
MPEERAQRLQQLEHGERIFRDVGLVFYIVENDEETIAEIRQKLGRYPEFAHVQKPTKKVSGFNIPQKSLKKGMFIPIPLKAEERVLEDTEFAEYCSEAIRDMRLHSAYGKRVDEILDRVDEDTLVATMIAAAKQESGGKPLGQFVFHRWEPGPGAFSFSIFHVVQTGPGIAARRKLNMTEGQLYHPKNAAQLFLAYLIEKNGRRTADYFPIDKDWDAWARMYNGKYWKRINPHYVGNMKKYYAQALQDEAPQVRPEYWAGNNVEMFPIQYGMDIGTAIRHSNTVNSNAAHRENILGNRKNVFALRKLVFNYLKTRYKSDKWYAGRDKIGIGFDAQGVFLIFQRDNDEKEVIYLPSSV